ncbi:MAG: threonine synthase [Kiritimatiellae bacterium]|nr:threonine synthase [Kiritimatiellia bacterium]
MHYISTRGRTPPMGFQDTVLEGLAPDGGLLIPERIPDVRDRLSYWATLSYQDLTFEVLREFVDLPGEDLRGLIERAYKAFAHPEIAPAWRVGPVWILELFHGPTLAFKDIALQFLSQFFEYVLEKRDARLNILGATSGDTGSAAIHGVRGQKRVNIFIMHPHGRVSPLQEKQMTSVLDANVFNLAIDGTFDDCQTIMKSVFRDVEFKRRYSLGSINSVNWARVMAQIVYYFSSGLYVMAQTGAPRVSFSVPTGNFGDVLAGWYAAQMGLPVGQLVLATNENDILARFFNTGTYRVGHVVPTLSPSMDIQVASNFERYLFYRMDRRADALSAAMESFAKTGSLSVSGRDELFRAGVGKTEDTLATIRRYRDEHGYLMDPHTAVGVHVAERHVRAEEPMICLSTAHPAKFSAAIEQATGSDCAHHPTLDALRDAPTRCDRLPNDEKAVREYLAARVG